MQIRRLHKILATILGLFIVAHLINHTALIFGPEAHIALMDKLRFLYRPLLIEIILYIAFIAQIVLGFLLLKARGKPRDRWGWAQVISGVIIALFLMQHLSAALMTRFLKEGFDTNVYWAAAVVSRPSFAWYFAPYYTLGLSAIFVHVASALYRRPKHRHFAPWIAAFGVIFAICIVAMLMGVTLPQKYENYLDTFWSFG